MIQTTRTVNSTVNGVQGQVNQVQWEIICMNICCDIAVHRPLLLGWHILVINGTERRRTDDRTWEDYLMIILGQRKEEREWGRHGNKWNWKSAIASNILIQIFPDCGRDNTYTQSGRRNGILYYILFYLEIRSFKRNVWRDNCPSGFNCK